MLNLGGKIPWIGYGRVSGYAGEVAEQKQSLLNLWLLLSYMGITEPRQRFGSGQVQDGGWQAWYVAAQSANCAGWPLPSPARYVGKGKASYCAWKLRGPTAGWLLPTGA